jgi:para-aminobenzoate synthetase/4-amino-4-deoxychorismate lyase
VAYEAAPAFDAALPVVASGAGPLPLVWFGVYDEVVPVPPIAPPESRAELDWRWAIDEATFERQVAVIREAIADGWTYQVNLTTRLTAPVHDARSLYAALAHRQQGAHNVLIETPSWAVACASPELFFERDGHHLTTRPMKGTAARSAGTDEDAAAAAALAASPKERAENVMIVDLLRNDVGRVARTGTVTVTSLFDVEAYPAMWQLTSTIEADVRPGTSLADTFRALFPCGSVTGAPKRSTMRLIASLEGRPRGVYCGAVGHVAPPGGPWSTRFAVGIRTATVAAGRAELGVGAGITWDSDPGAEWAELHTKASIAETGGFQVPTSHMRDLST